MMPVRKQELLQTPSLLAGEVSQILIDLTRDAEAHGFDITPYLKRLADLGLCDTSPNQKALDGTPRQLN